MKWGIWLWSILYLSGGISACFASCNSGENLDLRSIYPQIFSQLPIKNQGDYGICYAEAATTLIDFLRMLRKTDHDQDRKTNAVDAAEAASIFTTSESVEGGEICDVIDALVKRGYGCDSLGVLPTQLEGVGLIAQREIVNQVYLEYILNQKKFKPVDPKYFDYPHRKKLSADQLAYLNKFDQYMTWMRTYLAMRDFGPDALPTDLQFFIFAQNIQVNNLYDIFQSSFEALLGKKNCLATSFKMPKLTCQKTPLGYSDQILTRIDDQLKNQMPTGIDICSTVLVNHAFVGGGNYKSDACAAHALVVIGKKEEGGECSYLVRNSWGAQFRNYDWPTDRGDIWISESALRDNVFGVSTVQ
jgi:hypothetical protein